MKIFYKLKAVAVALIIAAAGFIPAAAYGNSAKGYKEGIIEYNLQKSSAASVQEWIDGELTRDAGEGSEWYIIALSNSGEYDFSAYRNALNGYLSANETGSASSRLKFALTYIAIGDKSNPYIDKALGNSIGEQGIMSLVFGLHLLNNGCISGAYSINGLIDELLSLQLADGGFSVTGEYGDVDVTAMTVQALAVHYDENSAVKAAVDKALDFLSARQLESGGFSSYGMPNPESAAQVIIAASSLGIDVCDDDRFIKNGKTVFDGMGSFRLSDGSFSHREGGDSDATATAQALSAAVAYENMKNGKMPFYIFDKNVNVPAETITEATETETVTAETTILTEKETETAGTAVITQSETAKTEQEKTAEEKVNPARLIVIIVCVVTLLICTVIFAMKKKKMFLIIAVAVAVIALITGIWGDNNKETAGYVTLSINCDVVKDSGKSHVPQNGIILSETKAEIKKGDTVYDVFAEVCKENGVLFSANMGYVEGINNIYEMDFGDNSGWIYFVNGESPSVGCASYELADGDKIEWHYTCDLDADIDIDFKKEYN